MVDHVRPEHTVAHERKCAAHENASSSSAREGSPTTLQRPHAEGFEEETMFNKRQKMGGEARMYCCRHTASTGEDVLRLPWPAHASSHKRSSDLLFGCHHESPCSDVFL